MPRKDWREDRRVVRLLLLGTGSTIKGPSTSFLLVHPIQIATAFSSIIQCRGEYLSKKSETVYPPIWGILKPENLRTEA